MILTFVLIIEQEEKYDIDNVEQKIMDILTIVITITNDVVGFLIEFEHVVTN